MHTFLLWSVSGGQKGFSQEECEWISIQASTSHLMSPQGSVLGPLLFLILIGDIDQDISHAFISSFADDKRLSSSVS